MSPKLTFKEAITKASITSGLLVLLGAVGIGMYLIFDYFEKAGQDYWNFVIVISILVIGLFWTTGFRETLSLVGIIVYVVLSGYGVYYLFEIGEMIWCIVSGVVAIFILIFWLYYER